MPDDWRIACSGDDDQPREADRGARLEGVHRGAIGLLAYESDEAAAERTYAAMNAAAAELGLDARVERWNPAAYVPGRASCRGRRTARSRLALQVIVRFLDTRTARDAWNEPDRYVLWRRGRRLAIGARDEEEAQEIVNDLRLSSPIETEIEVLPHRTDVIS